MPLGLMTPWDGKPWAIEKNMTAEARVLDRPLQQLQQHSVSNFPRKRLLAPQLKQPPQHAAQLLRAKPGTGGVSAFRQQH